MFEDLKQELYDFYLHGDAERSKEFADKCFAIMDERFENGMTVTAQKLLQYDVITEEFDPVIFRNSRFYYETGVLTSLSDGVRNAKGRDFLHANGWVYKRNQHLFVEQDEELYKRKTAQVEEMLYLICGYYNDDSQHFNFNFRPFLEIGARGIYEAAERELNKAENAEEKEFLNSVCHGMLSLRRIAEKFAIKAESMLAAAGDGEYRKNLSLIADTARRVPWEAPTSFYEALEALAFLRCAFGTLEGVGSNTFGRLDVDLYRFYASDVKRGILTPEEAYSLVTEFLILWDCHYDHGMLMSGYADHELENTYTLGGCDKDGSPVFNELTEMFLRATREEKIIFPKIKCRYSSLSPEEYLRLICAPIIKGTSTVLIQNDEATVSALVRAGRPLIEARDYRIAGCWDIITDREKSDHGDYLNLLKPFEYSIHNLYDKMDKVGIKFETLDGAKSFEELYGRSLKNFERLLDEKLRVKREGGGIWYKVDRLPIFSSTLEGPESLLFPE